MSTTPICWSALAVVVVLAVSLPVDPPKGEPPEGHLSDGTVGAVLAGVPAPTTVVVAPAVPTPMTTAAATPTAPRVPATASRVRCRRGGPAGDGGYGCTTNGAGFSVTGPVDGGRRSRSCETAPNPLGEPAHPQGSSRTRMTLSRPSGSRYVSPRRAPQCRQAGAGQPV